MNVELAISKHARTCEHCKAKIVWATDDEGSRYPLDARSTPDGTVALSEVNGALRAGRVTRLQAQGMAAAGHSLFKRHALTCPNASVWARNVSYRYAAPQRGGRRRTKR